MGFPRKEYWSGLSRPSPEDHPDPGIKLMSSAQLALQVDSLLLSHRGSPQKHYFILLWVNIQYPTVYMHHSFFIHSSVDGHLGCFCVLAIVNSTVVNTEVYVSLRIMVFSSYMPRTGIAGSYSKSILVLYRAPNCSAQWLYQFAYLPMVHEGLLLVDILMMAILTGGR